MKKLKICFVAVLCLISTTVLMAQDKTNNLAIGFNINQFQNDFGVGLHVISPYFANNKVALKVGGNVQWLQHAENNQTTWSPYGNIQVGIRSRHSVVEDKIFIYGEGGGVLLLPDSEFSSYKTVKGGYGLFGFEFKANHAIGYFVELGGMGTGAKADKVPLKPLYSNGFMSSVGLRINL